VRPGANARQKMNPKEAKRKARASLLKGDKRTSLSSFVPTHLAAQWPPWRPGRAPWSQVCGVGVVCVEWCVVPALKKMQKWPRGIAATP